MRLTILLSIAIVGAATSAHAQPADAPPAAPPVAPTDPPDTSLETRVRHVPPAEAEAGIAVELVAEAPATAPTLVAHVRPAGRHDGFSAIEMVRRDEAHWIAVVPAADVVAPGLEYYLEAGGRPVFATAAWPHRIEVHVPPDDARRERDRLRSADRRSRVHTSAEWVEYGSRRMAGVNLVDHYYRVDADFSYRLWAYPLEELRVGYTRLIGETQATEMQCGSTTPCTREAGFKVAGWFELGLAAVEGIRFDGRLVVMATQAGFAVGTRGEARLGVREGSHVAVGVEYLADVGTNGYFRLGWGTVPHLPMAATVEITNLPASNRDTAVRLYYDIAHEVAGVRLGVRVGYAARSQEVAGFTGGATASVDF